MKAFIVKNKAGWHNIIAYNEGWIVWDTDITEAWAAALKALVHGLELVEPFPYAMPEWLISDPELPSYGDGGTCTAKQMALAQLYAEKHFPKD